MRVLLYFLSTIVYSGLLVGLLDNAGAQKLKLWYDKLSNASGEAHSDVAVTPIHVEWHGAGIDQIKKADHNVFGRVARINKVPDAIRDMPNQLPKVAFAELAGLAVREHHQVRFNRASPITLSKCYASFHDPSKEERTCTLTFHEEAAYTIPLPSNPKK